MKKILGEAVAGCFWMLLMSSFLELGLEFMVPKQKALPRRTLRIKKISKNIIKVLWEYFLLNNSKIINLI